MRELEELEAAVVEQINLSRENEKYAADPEREDWLQAHDARTTAESFEMCLGWIREKLAKATKKEKKTKEAKVAA